MIVPPGPHRIMVCRHVRDTARCITYYEPAGSLLIKGADGITKRATAKLKVWRNVSTEGRKPEMEPYYLKGRFSVFAEAEEMLAKYGEKCTEEMYKWLQEQNIEYHGLMHPWIRSTPTCQIFPASAGIGELDMLAGSVPTVVRQWNNAVNLARGVIKFVNPSDAFFETLSKPLLEMVGSTALVLLGGAYPMHSERVDDRGHPLWGLYTSEDCDGKALSVVSFFLLLTKTLAKLKSRERKYWRKQNLPACLVAEHLAATFNDGCIVQCMVDPAVAAGKKPCAETTSDSKLWGHVVAALIRKDRPPPWNTHDGVMFNALIVDGTCCVTPHFREAKYVSVEEAYRDTMPGIHDVQSGGGRMQNRIFKPSQKLGGISGVQPVEPKAYQKFVSFYFKDCMCVASPHAKEPLTDVAYDNATMQYVRADPNNPLHHSALQETLEGDSPPTEPLFQSPAALLSGKTRLAMVPRTTRYPSKLLPKVLETMLTETTPRLSLDVAEEAEKTLFCAPSRPEVEYGADFTTLVNPDSESVFTVGIARVAAFCKWAMLKVHPHFHDRVQGL